MGALLCIYELVIGFLMQSVGVEKGLWFVWCYKLCTCPIATIVVPRRWLFGSGGLYFHGFVLKGVEIVLWGNL
jgi:hypothetical protein